MLRFDDKIAIVTGFGSRGAGWGNGKAIATVLARQGARVVGLDRDEVAAEDTRIAIEAEGGRVYPVIADITNGARVQSLVAECEEKFGRIDVLVNNVGVSAPGNVSNIEESLWDSQIEINLKTAFLMSKAVIPAMARGGGGAIVNISSISGLRHTGKDQIAYSTAKAAIVQFTRMAGVMHAREKVRVNCVVPGLIHTPLVERLAATFAAGDYEGFIARRNAQVPLGSMGSAFDVANAVAFLASDEAKYITAAELVVDGGLTWTCG